MYHGPNVYENLNVNFADWNFLMEKIINFTHWIYLDGVVMIGLLMFILKTVIENCLKLQDHFLTNNENYWFSTCMLIWMLMFIISCRAVAQAVAPGWEIMKMGHVCPCMGACVHWCVKQFSLNLLQLQVFCTKKSPNQFLCPPIFFRFCGLNGLKIKWVMAILSEKNGVLAA